jgi:hypothetical protein
MVKTIIEWKKGTNINLIEAITQRWKDQCPEAILGVKNED